MSEKRKIAIFQSASTPVPEENLKKAENAVAEARAYAPAVLVFPECFMCYFEKKQTIPEKSAIVKSTHGMFLKRMQELAKEAGFWILFGCYEPAEDPAELRCYNTVYVLDENGDIVYLKSGRRPHPQPRQGGDECHNCKNEAACRVTIHSQNII